MVLESDKADVCLGQSELLIAWVCWVVRLGLIKTCVWWGKMELFVSWVKVLEVGQIKHQVWFEVSVDWVRVLGLKNGVWVCMLLLEMPMDLVKLNMFGAFMVRLRGLEG